MASGQDHTWLASLGELRVQSHKAIQGTEGLSLIAHQALYYVFSQGLTYNSSYEHLTEREVHVALV